MRSVSVVLVACAGCTTINNYYPPADLAADDLAVADRAVADLGMPDETPAPDLATPQPDLTLVADLTTLVDSAAPDLAAPDLTVLPDLTPCPDGTDTASDPGNCGACGNACTAGYNCCSSACSNPANDVKNCGGCGIVCTAPNGAPTCVLRQCAIASCNAGWSDCNRMIADGCEANTTSDPKNCGACNVVCAGACVGGRCQ